MILATLLILAEATPPAVKPVKPVDPGLQGMQMMVMMAFAFALIYFISIRPQAKKQKDLLARVSALKTGDKVVTSSGIHGIVANVKDGSTLSLKIADNVKIEIDKTAIANVLSTDSAKSGGAPVVEVKS